MIITVYSTDVTIIFDSDTGTDTTDSAGGFSFTFLILSSTSGAHTISATQTTNQGTISDSKTFTVVPKMDLSPDSGTSGTSVMGGKSLNWNSSLSHASKVTTHVDTKMRVCSIIGNSRD